MNENLREELRATMGASIPALAISSPETSMIIRDVVLFAYTLGASDGVPKQVLIWRESVGFEEYAVYRTGADGVETQLKTCMTQDIAPYCDVRKTGRIESPDDEFPGASVPFAIEFIKNYDEKEEGCGAVFILRDWHRFVDANADHVDRQLALFEDIVEGLSKTIVMLCPSRWKVGEADSDNLPIELANYVRLAKYPLPNKSDRIKKIEEIISIYITDTRFRPSLGGLTADDIETIADACAGLSRQYIDDVLNMSLSVRGYFDVSFILNEKRKAVEQAGFTLLRPDIGFETIGGLTPLKQWVRLISRRFTQAARDYGFTRNLRGLLMAGVPGCGKTAVAKAMAHEMNMNILMVEAQNLKGSLVGESEAKVHRLLDIARAAAPLIVFVDEAEKLLGKSEGIHDGGAHDAVLGQFLTFMQEDDSGVFFVFTANNMNKFAPELVDRFEGRFFIDLPEPEERKEIINIHLKLRKQNADGFDLTELVRKTANFSGRNIEDGIEEAMTISFSEDRPLEMNDLLSVFDIIVPTSKTKKDEIEHMRSFVENGSMRKANNAREESPTSSSARSRVRTFD